VSILRDTIFENDRAVTGPFNAGGLGGGQNGIGSPVGVTVPDFLNQLYHDTDADTYWRSIGMMNEDWVVITGGSIVNYKVYRAVLTQSGTDAPTATVLENSLEATIAWTRTNVGIYLGTSSIPDLFSRSKTYLSAAMDQFNGSAAFALVGLQSTSEVYMVTNNFGVTADFGDGLFIEILVYP